MLDKNRGLGKRFTKRVALVNKVGSELFIAIPNFGLRTHTSQGWRRAVKGAKKYVNSRVRFHENQALKKIATGEVAP